jgi:hypothetical protein
MLKVQNGRGFETVGCWEIVLDVQRTPKSTFSFDISTWFQLGFQAISKC